MSNKLEVTIYEDGHDCETCGGSFAMGGFVMLNGVEILDYPGVAACFGGSSYSESAVWAGINEECGLGVDAGSLDIRGDCRKALKARGWELIEEYEYYEEDYDMALVDDIIEEMNVKPVIDLDLEVNRRVEFIKNVMAGAGTKKLVLGISGGVDSTLAGRLCQLAVDGLNESGEGFQFVAVRLPYGIQADEDDAQEALSFIKPSRSVQVDIREAVKQIDLEVICGLSSIGVRPGWDDKDFAKGNAKARMRMIAQYQIAGLIGGLVVGTDHSAEAVSGFYTKHGDGACDFAPLFGLNKRQVRALAKHLGAPKRLWDKEATADLEDGKPQLSDEEALGVTYDQIDDFLEGRQVDLEAEQIIVNRYQATEHKRNPPVSPLYA